MTIGTIILTGIGPGTNELMSPQAKEAISKSTAICGYDKYVDQIREFIPSSCSVFTSGMTGEMDRVQKAIDFASEGHTVSIICGGDPSLYSLASLTYQMANGSGNNIEIIPGITAAMAASSKLGAPIADDMCIISMSDLLTPWDLIKKRIDAVNEGDFVAAIYNPKSNKRKKQLAYALNRFYEKRGDLLCGTVKNAYRDDEVVMISRISDFHYEFVDMSCIVIVGNTRTEIRNGKLVTPRGYPV
jgi:precorrin-3B C17-methyltransferase